MNSLAKTEAPKPLMVEMADKYGLQPAEFTATVRSTCGMGKASAEEFAAFIMVAKEYDLNPLLKEIYAFPAKGGGIVPIVSIDGWVNLINSHPACDGFEFEFEHSEDGKELISCTCRMYRKDRGRPVSVTEYLAECVRSTDPWKMKHRMLRHKAMIQAARYAFGFSGVYDEDEGSKIADMRDVTPTKPQPPKPPVPPSDMIEHNEDGVIVDEPSVIDGEILRDAAPIDATEFFEALEAELAAAGSVEDIEEAWTARDPMSVFEGDETNQAIAMAIKKRRLKVVGA